VHKGQTRPTKAKWTEDFDIIVDRAHDVELAVHEKGGSILALVWFKISELDAMLKVSGHTQKRAVSSVVEGGEKRTIGLPKNPNQSGMPNAGMSSTAEGVEAWLDLEPAGQINIKLNFTPDESLKTKVRQQRLFHTKRWRCKYLIYMR
jgi:classical protein kinase C/novel protein kinase C epsilon type